MAKDEDAEEPVPYVSEVDGMVLATRGGSRPLWVERATSEWPSFPHTVGQDGFHYVVLQSFTHPFVPYISQTTGEPNGGCDRCGWSERIHSDPITHVSCDECGEPSPVDDILNVESDDHYGRRTMFKEGPRPLTIEVAHRQVRYFCSEACEAAWFTNVREEGQ